VKRDHFFIFLRPLLCNVAMLEIRALRSCDSAGLKVVGIQDLAVSVCIGRITSFWGVFVLVESPHFGGFLKTILLDPNAVE